jgi:hypothetical protein
MTLKEEFEKIRPFLDEHGKEIGEKARLGNKKALEIIKYYKMFYDCHEAGSLVFLEGAIENYKNDKP